LIVDLPPGTGDAQLTLVQSVPLAGVVIVSTPQAVCLTDGVKGIEMFRKLKVPILGLIENMSGFECPECHHTTDIFTKGGGADEAKKFDIPFLGAIPIDPRIVKGGDTGRPIVVAEPATATAKIFMDIAGRVAANISIQQHSPEEVAAK
jgi:ATP-binding protein involved in chromosome partitioning